MEVEKVMTPGSSQLISGEQYYELGEESKYVVIDEDDEVEETDGPLPGFRFHPTDEELVSFYLRRKVKKKPISIEIIREVDIYKHDPWDLAKASSLGDKEWYFYCKRGRKYRNSIRPNRVTGSGFWKATGIDRPIYSNKGGDHHHCCIGLKKSLVYYRGSAGKGTKTDWMMHEFRLPGNHHPHNHQHQLQSQLSNSEVTAEEAEIWTLCRIFKRNRKYTPDWRELSAKRTSSSSISNSKTCHSTQSSNNTKECYISFENPSTQKQPIQQYQPKVEINHHTYRDFEDVSRLLMEDDGKDSYLSSSTTHVGQYWTSMGQISSTPLNRLDYSPAALLLNPPVLDQSNRVFADAYNENLDDLSSVVEVAIEALPNIGNQTCRI